MTSHASNASPSSDAFDDPSAPGAFSAPSRLKLSLLYTPSPTHPSSPQGISVDELKSRMVSAPSSDAFDDPSAPGAFSAPSRLKLSLLYTYVRTAQIARSTGVAIYNSSIGKLAGSPLAAAPPPMGAMPDVAAIARQLAEILGHQV
jgi:hypothetical protein